MVGPFRCRVSTPQLRSCFARPGPQTAFGLSRAIHRAPHFARWRSLVAVLLFIAHCGLSLLGLTPHSVQVLVQPAKPKGRFTMAQRCVKCQLLKCCPRSFQSGIKRGGQSLNSKRTHIQISIYWFLDWLAVLASDTSYTALPF
jgi:hypothetical protein